MQEWQKVYSTPSTHRMSPHIPTRSHRDCVHIGFLLFVDTSPQLVALPYVDGLSHTMHPVTGPSASAPTVLVAKVHTLLMPQCTYVHTCIDTCIFLAHHSLKGHMLVSARASGFPVRTELSCARCSKETMYTFVCLVRVPY